MIAASVQAVDLGTLLLDLLIILAAGKVGAEISDRLRVPAVVGQVALGVLIGPSVVDILSVDALNGGSVAAVGTLGVLVLVMQAGMEVDLRVLSRVGIASVLVAVVGVVAPFAGGVLAGVWLGYSASTSILIGTALTATSVGISARVFGELRALATTEARVVLGAGLVENMVALAILTVAVRVVDHDDIGVGTVLGAAGSTIGFVVLAGAVGADSGAARPDVRSRSRRIRRGHNRCCSRRHIGLRSARRCC